jgi:hypothetical protein
MTNVASTSAAVAWRRLGRVTGVAGLATIVVFFIAVVGTRDEPPFTAPATEFLAYYRSPDTDAAPFRSFLFTAWLVMFVCFVGALTTLLRRAEGEAPWRSAIAMGCGVLFVALGLSGRGTRSLSRSAPMTSTLRSPGTPSIRDKRYSPTAGWRLVASPGAAAGSSSQPDSFPAGWDGWPSRAEWGS